MNKRRLWKWVRCAACAALVLGLTVQINTPAVYAVQLQTFIAAEKSLKEELLQSGNAVTEYVNEEDHQLKTILWAKGVTPPKMGGEDSQFKKQITYGANGKPAYVDYIAPYQPGNGWYDVNKSKNFAQLDMNLCFAAAASNSLHWWMDQNAEYINRYLAENPTDTQIQKLNDLRFSFENQQKSGVYSIFVRQFANKQDGYWPDILQDQFINGYYPKPNGGTHDSPADREKLLKEGPDKNGGFFFKVFGTDLLTDRRYYDNGFEAINRELKQLFLQDELVLMTYSVGRNSHVVTLWGVEFDENGNVCAVYYSDSDDEANQGMMRYRIVNSNGKAVVTTHVEGKGRSVVQSLQTLSLGNKQWKNYFKEEPKTLELVWNDTEMVYNGALQAPTVSAANIAPGDNVALSVQGAGVDAGTYTAVAVLSGPDAQKYLLPEQNTHIFEIKKAPAPQIVYPTASTLKYGQQLADSILYGGSKEYGRFSWENEKMIPTVNNTGYPVRFIPSESTLKNYEPVSAPVQKIPVVVNPKKLIVAADDQVNVMQGDPMPEFTYTVKGLVNEDRFENPVFVVSAKDTSVPGKYEIKIQGGSLTNAESYSVIYVSGKLVVQQKELPPEPTASPVPTAVPTAEPTASPVPTAVPTAEPTASPVPTAVPTAEPTASPVPTAVPTAEPTASPVPTAVPTAEPTASPVPTAVPTAEPTASPVPTAVPTAEPTASPVPTAVPTAEPTASPVPTAVPTAEPTASPVPTAVPTAEPTASPVPTAVPTAEPTASPVLTAKPTAAPNAAQRPAVNQSVVLTPEKTEAPLPLKEEGEDFEISTESQVPSETPQPTSMPQNVPTETPEVDSNANTSTNAESGRMTIKILLGILIVLAILVAVLFVLKQRKKDK